MYEELKYDDEFDGESKHKQYDNESKIKFCENVNQEDILQCIFN